MTDSKNNVIKRCLEILFIRNIMQMETPDDWNKRRTTNYDEEINSKIKLLAVLLAIYSYYDNCFHKKTVFYYIYL